MASVDSAGATIYYDVYGNGPPLFLLHGGANDRGVWGPAGYLEPLAEKFQVIAIDLRGAGESTSTATAAEYSMEHYVWDVLAIADALSLEKVSIWGVSMGGQVALAVAAAHHDRVRALIIAGADLEGWSASPDDYRGFADAIEGGGMEVVVEGFDDPKGSLPQWMLDAMRRSDPHAFAASMRARADWPGVVNDLEKMRMPILFIGGEDEYEPDALEAMAASVPDGRSLRVPNANHIQAFINAGYVVPRVIGFIRSVP